MRRVLLLVVSALLVLPAPAAQAARSRGAVPVTAGLDRATVSVHDGAAHLGGERAWPRGIDVGTAGASGVAWRRMVAGALVRLGAPAEMASPVVAGEYWFAQATQPTGDLDGDGGRDLLLTRWEFGQDAPMLFVEAVRGSDGSQLWAKEYAGFAHARPAQVGPDGRAGVLVTTFDEQYSGLFVGGYGQLTTTVEALGGDGAAVWTRTFDGTVLDTGAASLVRGVVLGVDVLQAVGGVADDVLVSQLDVLAAPGTWQATATASVLDGGDGLTASSAQEQDDTGREPMAVAAGDLSGDGGDDLLFLSGTYEWEATDGRITAASGADGSHLWTREGIAVDPWIFVERPGDMTGDGREELLLSSFADRTVVLDGASGDTRWARAGQIATPAGDADGDGRTEVTLTRIGYGMLHIVVVGDVVVTGPVPSEEPSSPVPTSEAGSESAETTAVEDADFIAPREFGIVTQRVDGDGEAVRVDKVAVRKPRGDFESRLAYEDIGDADSDGVPDAVVSVLVADMERERFAHDRRVISGRSGASLWTPALHTLGVGGAVDGAGDDVVTIRAERWLDVRDGRTGRLLWSAKARPSSWRDGIRAADFTGDGRADLLLTSSRSIRVLDGRTGTTRWTNMTAGADGMVVVAEPGAAPPIR